MSETHERQFTGWFIPRQMVELFTDGTLSATELLLLATVDSFVRNSEKGCFASNAFLADQLRVEKDTISKAITRLTRMELLEHVAFDGRRRYLVTCWSAATAERAGKILSRVGSKSYAASDRNPIPPPLKVGANKQMNTERAALRGGFFGGDKLLTFPEQAAKKLEQIIREHRKLQATPNPKQWVREMEMLLKEVGDTARIKKTIKWYAKHIGEPYVPQAYSAKSFREKFHSIESKLEMGGLEKAAQHADSFEPTEQDREVFELLENETWPKGCKSQLLEVIHHSLVNAKQWRKKCWALHDADPSDTVSGLVEHLAWSLTNNAERLVVLWLRAVSKQVATWKDWSGDLHQYIFTPEHKMFQKMGRTEDAAYAGQSSTLWQQLMTRINEN